MGGYGYGAMPMRRAVRPVIRAVRYRGLRSTDVLFASYPKSGSTWLRFMFLDLLTGRDPEWDAVTKGFPHVGAHRDLAPLLPNAGRLLYTHDKATGPVRRCVYLVRDGRDVALSEYRWLVRGGYTRPFSDFLDDFLSGRSHLFGSWTDHVLYWLDTDVAQRGDLHLVKFEDLRADTDRAVGGIVRFLGLDVSDDDIARAVRNQSLERMRAKEDRAPEAVLRRHRSGERFVGKGAVGGWKSSLDVEQNARLEAGTRPALERLGYPLQAHAA
jgi:hypothetical protein